MPKKYILSLLIFLIVVAIVSCGPIMDQSTQVSGTQTLLRQDIIKTVTARAVQQGKSANELATAIAYATVISQTTTAQAVLNDAAYQATATAFAPVLEELPRYGVNPLDGYVAWMNQSASISLSGPQQYGYANDYPEITAKDFVIASDITWNTQYGLSGCGFMFRSDGNSKTPSQLMVTISRFAEGSMVFSAMAEGNVTNMHVYYPWTKDKIFNWQNDSSNRLVIVARGNLIDIYTNGVKVAEVDTTKPPPTTLNLPTIPQLPLNATIPQLEAYQQEVDQLDQSSNQLEAELLQAEANYYSSKVAYLTDGFLGFAGTSSSGTALCKFSNDWLFLINPPPTATPTITPTFNGTPLTITPTLTPTPTLKPTSLYYFLTPSATATKGSVPRSTAVPSTSVPATATQAPTAAPTAAPTSPPATEAPTSPPATSPPATSPPATSPPATSPPATSAPTSSG